MLFSCVGALTFGQGTFQGAWQSDKGVMIISSEYFSYAEFDSEAFHGTKGGTYAVHEGQGAITFEFDTWRTEKLNEIMVFNISLMGDQLEWGSQRFLRIDDGAGGDLTGAWKITGRFREGELRERPEGPRKTMKILSSTRFQWIAYHTETGEFFGSGGGTYTTQHGEYSEVIDFFSRDQERVGATLAFHYQIIDGRWHHMGKSTRGEDIHEVWSLR